MMKLLNKELKLTANPLTYVFILFAFMTLLPGYPILCGAFFICLGIFYTFERARECDDIMYTVLLPVKKSDVVKAKYLFVVFIELVGTLICVLLTILRMTALKDGQPYLVNALMNANVLYLGFLLIIFTTFNVIFLIGFFKTAYKFGKPFIIFCIVALLEIGIAETLHYLPGLSYLNNTSGTDIFQICFLICSIIAYVGITLVSLKVSQKHFEQIDL